MARRQIGLGLGLVAAVLVGACGGDIPPAVDAKPEPTNIEARLPMKPGEHGPSLVQIDKSQPGEDLGDGTMLADVDSCATCHPAAAKQWSSSAHSFASFGNPIYRENVQLARDMLGKPASQHCGGCHDMPLLVDEMMTVDAPIPGDDLRSHSGVTCRLCHGIEKVTKDGNGSYVWSRAPIAAPDLKDPASIEQHKAQVTVKKLGTEICVGCHRGFLSPDMGDGMPVHLSGLDEPGAWRNSAWSGNGIGRVDKVDKKTCIDCHMEREGVGDDEVSRHADGTLASHRFVGGHTWMASMRGDDEHLRRTQAKLAGIASIDIAGALSLDHTTKAPVWTLPADGAQVVPGERLSLDVVVRNLLVGHRFPGGVLDIQDTWIELAVTTRSGRVLAQNGKEHETDPKDESAHVLRTLVVDEKGEVLEGHEMPKFRTQIATQTLAPREAQAIRYAFDVPATLEASDLPLTVTAKLRHRARTLAMQQVVCDAAKTPEGERFITGAKGARSVHMDPCKAQPITEIASATIELGAGAAVSKSRPAWEREYEHGMALVSTVSERLEEARAVLEHALREAPDDKARAMITVQLASVASKQGRNDDALALVRSARALLKVGPGEGPPVLDAVAADALVRVWHWDEAIEYAKACAKRAPQNAASWVVLAKVLGSAGDDRGALEAAVKGLELNPRDPDLLRSQATALSALGRPEAADALAAYDRFRSPDNSAELRIHCAGATSRCAREREQGHTHLLH